MITKDINDLIEESIRSNIAGRLRGLSRGQKIALGAAGVAGAGIIGAKASDAVYNKWADSIDSKATSNFKNPATQSALDRKVIEKAKIRGHNPDHVFSNLKDSATRESARLQRIKRTEAIVKPYKRYKAVSSMADPLEKNKMDYVVNGKGSL